MFQGFPLVDVHMVSQLLMSESHESVCWILLGTSCYLYTTTLCPWAEVRVGSSERSQLTL